jgi:hypothetical protein
LNSVAHARRSEVAIDVLKLIRSMSANSSLSGGIPYERDFWRKFAREQSRRFSL